MKIPILVGIATVVIISAVAAGVSQQDEEKNQIRIVFFANISHAVPIIGLENGNFAEELDNVHVKEVIVDSGPQAIEALLANSADIAYVGPTPFINGYVKSGNGLRIISGATTNGASLVVQEDSQIRSASDLAGKKIAAPSIGNTQDVSLRYYLSENGLKPAEKGGNIIIYNTANPEIFTLFAKKEIDAAWVPEPTATILVEQLGGRVLFHEKDIWPNKQFPSVLLVARADFVERHPDLIDKWLKAHKETIQWINENPEKTQTTFIEFYKKHTGKTLPAGIINGAFSNIIFTEDPMVDSIHLFAEHANSLGYLGRKGYSLDDAFYSRAMLGVQ